MDLDDDSNASTTDYVLPGWGTGPEGVVVYVEIQNTRLNINVNAEDFHRSPKALEHLVINKAKFCSDSSDDVADSFEYCEEVAAYFLPTLRSLVPEFTNSTRLTLADIALHKVYRARAEFYDEVLVPSPIVEEDCAVEAEEDSVHPHAVPESLPFPRFRTSEVEIVYEDITKVFELPTENVMLHGNRLYWKPSWISFDATAVIDKYCKIHNSGLSPRELPTPRLYGIVVNDKGILRGQLYVWIDIAFHLTWDVLEKTCSDTRMRWVSQIRAAVSSLHAIDVIWGNVKASNIVIDADGNVVILDLEGNPTKGWIDEDKVRTKEGDLQGLERLTEYILNDCSPLRVQDKLLDHNCSIEEAQLPSDS